MKNVVVCVGFNNKNNKKSVKTNMKDSKEDTKEDTKENIEPTLGKKGETGKNTGGAARKEIERLQRGGMSLKEIGERAGRSASTISQIKQGTIKNPPESLIKKLRSIKAENVYGVDVWLTKHGKDLYKL